jgi:hypothetical protein
MDFLDKVGKLIYFNGRCLEFFLSNKQSKKIKILFNSDLMNQFKEIEDLEDKKIWIYFNSTWQVVVLESVRFFEHVHTFNSKSEVDIYYSEFREPGLQEIREFKLKSLLDSED